MYFFSILTVASLNHDTNKRKMLSTKKNKQISKYYADLYSYHVVLCDQGRRKRFIILFYRRPGNLIFFL